MKRLAIILLCVPLIGCANSLTREETAALDATLNVLEIIGGVVSLVSGNPAGFLGAIEVASGVTGLTL